MKYGIGEDSAKLCMLEAFKMAQNSTCARRRVGAVIVDRQGNPVSGGFNHHSNGISCEAKFFEEYSRDLLPDSAELALFLSALKTKPAIAHSLEDLLSLELSAVWKSFQTYTKTDEFKAHHRSWQDTEIHSELHAIISAYKMGKSVENCILFSSRSPCIACAHAIIESGISTVYYTEVSEAGKGGIPILDQAGVKTIHLEIDHDYYT